MAEFVRSLSGFSALTRPVVVGANSRFLALTLRFACPNVLASSLLKVVARLLDVTFSRRMIAIADNTPKKTAGIGIVARQRRTGKYLYPYAAERNRMVWNCGTIVGASQDGESNNTDTGSRANRAGAQPSGHGPSG